jgi:PEGA domain
VKAGLFFKGFADFLPTIGSFSWRALIGLFRPGTRQVSNYAGGSMKASAAMKQEPTPSEASLRPTPFASAPKSEFIWPVPPEELARVVFDNKDLERKVTAHSAGEEDHPETPTGGQTRERGTSAKWWVPALLLVTGFESTYLGVRAVHDWRRADDPTPHESVLPARPIVNPFVNLLPTSAVALAAAAAASQPEATPLDEIAPAALTPQPGWVSIDLPIQVEVYENGRFVGSSDRNQFALSAGQHELELVNESLKYRSSQSVVIQPGHATFISVSLPMGYLSLNAQPWSEVLIDGKPVGETPIGNLEFPIGPHRVVFRHPVHGEQTRTVVLAAGATMRLSVDLRQSSTSVEGQRQNASADLIR